MIVFGLLSYSDRNVRKETGENGKRHAHDSTNTRNQSCNHWGCLGIWAPASPTEPNTEVFNSYLSLFLHELWNCLAWMCHYCYKSSLKFCFYNFICWQSCKWYKILRFDGISLCRNHSLPSSWSFSMWHDAICKQSKWAKANKSEKTGQLAYFYSAQIWQRSWIQLKPSGIFMFLQQHWTQPGRTLSSTVYFPPGVMLAHAFLWDLWLPALKSSLKQQVCDLAVWQNRLVCAFRL